MGQKFWQNTAAITWPSGISFHIQEVIKICSCMMTLLFLMTLLLPSVKTRILPPPYYTKINHEPVCVSLAREPVSLLLPSKIRAKAWVTTCSHWGQGDTASVCVMNMPLGFLSIWINIFKIQISFSKLICSAHKELYYWMVEKVSVLSFIVDKLAK